MNQSETISSVKNITKNVDLFIVLAYLLLIIPPHFLFISVEEFFGQLKC